MAIRFTNTDKWTADAWFINLKSSEKLLFIYMCDNCDVAGFIEYIPRKWSFDTGIDARGIESAIKGLEKCYLTSANGSSLFIKNFIKHQKNIPLRPDFNKAHVGIMRRLESQLQSFGFESINDFLNTPTKGLESPSGIGSGKGSGDGSGISKPAWAEKFKHYHPEITYPFQYPEFGQKWDLWIAYRSESGIRAYKRIGEQAALKKLAKMSNGQMVKAIQIIDESIANSWQGLFPIKNNNGKQFITSDQELGDRIEAARIRVTGKPSSYRTPPSGEGSNS